MNNGLFGVPSGRKSRISLGRRRLAGSSLVYWRNIPSWATRFTLVVDSVAHSSAAAAYYFRVGKSMTPSSNTANYSSVRSNLLASSLTTNLDSAGVQIFNGASSVTMFASVDITRVLSQQGIRWVVRASASQSDATLSVSTGIAVVGNPNLKTQVMALQCTQAMIAGVAELFAENDDI